MQSTTDQLKADYQQSQQNKVKRGQQVSNDDQLMQQSNIFSN